MKKLFVEIADSPTKREYGLMDRKSIAKNEGMLFKFPNKANLSFWMKNTYVPLDIAFIDDSGKILQIETMHPLSTRAVVAQKPCKYALEVCKGWFKDNNITVGGRISNLDICDRQKRFAQMTTPQQLPQAAPQAAPSPMQQPADQNQPPVVPDPNQANPQQQPNPEVQLDMSTRSKLDYATNYNLPIMIVYRTLQGNTLPPRKLLPIPNKGYPIEGGKNGYQFKAWDASPTISGMGMEIEGGHPKSFMLDGVISLEIIDEGKKAQSPELTIQNGKQNENKL